MRFETYIARRYLSTRRKPLFVSFLLMMTVGAVATGVFALIFVLAVMKGFERDFRGRVLGFKAPLTVMSETAGDLQGRRGEFAKADWRITRVIPFADGEAILESQTGSTTGVRVRGLGEPPTERRVGKLRETAPFSEESAVMGEELAETLGISPFFEEKIRVTFPFGDIAPTGELTPKVKEFRPTGTFRSGFYDYDSKYLLIPYEQARRLFGREAREGLEIWVDPPEAADAVKERLLQKMKQGEMASGKLITWREQNPKLFAAMKLERIGMFLLLAMILLVASFNIFGLTSLAVVDKMKDIAILRAAGLSARRARRIFLFQAGGIGLAGALVGGLLGLVTTSLLTRFPVRLPVTYYLENLPLYVDPVDVVLVLLLVPLVTTVAALYPAREAGRLSPVEALRYE